MFCICPSQRYAKYVSKFKLPIFFKWNCEWFSIRCSPRHRHILRRKTLMHVSLTKMRKNYFDHLRPLQPTKRCHDIPDQIKLWSFVQFRLAKIDWLGRTVVWTIGAMVSFNLQCPIKKSAKKKKAYTSAQSHTNHLILLNIGLSQQLS